MRYLVILFLILLFACRGPELPQLKSEAAVLAGGNIVLEGQVSIDGLESFTGKPTATLIHSNSSEANPFSWKQLESKDSLEIEGTVSSPASSPASWPSGATVKETSAAAEPMALPEVDITTLVESEAQSLALSLTPPVTEVPVGRYFLKPTQPYKGDLVLRDGALVAVQGDFNIRGTITGRGTLLVDGGLTFYGTAEVSAGNRVQILVKENIKLEGYEGTSFINSIPESADDLRVLDLLLMDLEDLIMHPHSPPPTLPKIPEGSFKPADLSHGIFGNWGALDRINHQLYNPELAIIFNESLGQGMLPRLLSRTREAEEKPGRNFAVRKLAILGRFFWYLPDTPTKQVGLKDFRETPRTTSEGAVDAIFDLANPKKPEDYGLVLAVRSVSRDHRSNWLGHAFFEGILYAQGDILVDKEIIVHGSLIAAGDITLRNCRITQLKDLDVPPPPPRTEAKETKGEAAS